MIDGVLVKDKYGRFLKPTTISTEGISRAYEVITEDQFFHTLDQMFRHDHRDWKLYIATILGHVPDYEAHEGVWG